MNSKIVVHRAPWLLSIAGPPVQDGGIAVGRGRILAVGRFGAVARGWPGAVGADHPNAVLLPGLINAHAHLELSHLAHLARRPAPPTFAGWIAHLLAERARTAADDESIRAAALTVLAEQHAQGVAAIADISNTGLARSLAASFPGRLLCFKEHLGLRAADAKAAIQCLQTESDKNFCTGHAPYSTRPELLRALKERADRLGHAFPIHVAESTAENELLRSGSGEMREFLEQRGLWDGSLPLVEDDAGGSVAHLRQHGLVDCSTICVHCIHVSEKEIELLAEAEAKVCLCPGSNRHLGVGTAPATLFLKKGLLPALGTDSLASNPELSLWREMRLLAEDHADLDPADILAMATLGGAAALGLDQQLGTLEAGKDAVVLAAELPEPMPDAAAAIEQLVQGCCQRPKRL